MDDDKEAREVAMQQMTRVTNHLKMHKNKNNKARLVYLLIILILGNEIFNIYFSSNFALQKL